MNTSKLNPISTALLAAAKQSQNHAYAPYSGFKVGAALIADNGKIYAGCNVENASYPLGTCAEAGAISAMIADGATKIQQLLIVGPTDEHCFPCGGCRQKIAEFSSPETPIIMSGATEHATTIGELLPSSFSLD